MAQNLSQKELIEGCPWDFNIDPENNWPKKMTKGARRTAMADINARWNVYTSMRGVAANLIISKSNPVAGLRGLVADYDMVTDIPTVLGYIQQIPKSVWPNFIEISMSNKIRLVWIFEKEILTPTTEFAQELLLAFFAKIGIPTLLAGFDEVGSIKPTERWTNGAIWYPVEDDVTGPQPPLPWDYCFGVVCSVSKKSRLFDQSQIPIETIAAEVQTRFPGRWQGDFRIDALGVRFWDEVADNPTGCQVKPDGMLCFTGNEPFKKWESIFGHAWCEEQKILNLGKAGENIIFDGKSYWEQSGNRWITTIRADIMLRLKNRGLSDKAPKGETQSDVERVLSHIQLINRVEGAAPFVNYKPGLLEINGTRFLNVANIQVTQPIRGPTGIPVKDFPFLSHFIRGLFAHPELGPLDHFLAWLKFGHIAFLNYEKRVGQAIFLCGPHNNGKTLLCNHVVAPMLGGRTANPMEYLTGQTTFNDELFHAGLLAINDEDSPRNDGERSKMLMRLKSLVVNPTHTYHPKFCNRVTIYWTGRIFITLNDDPGSVGVLPEVGSNTADKMMFFASQAYQGKWPKKQQETESMLATELPYFSDWLSNVYEPPEGVLSSDFRGGVRSYYDPTILELSRQQLYAFNLEELLRAWFRVSPYWIDEGHTEWIGSPTDLLTDIGSWESLRTVAKEWTQSKVAKALTALAKQQVGGVEFYGDTTREFRIIKDQI